MYIIFFFISFAALVLYFALQIKYHLGIDCIWNILLLLSLQITKKYLDRDEDGVGERERERMTEIKYTMANMYIPDDARSLHKQIVKSLCRFTFIYQWHR